MTTRDAKGRALAAEMRRQLAGLEAEFALCAIWHDSGSGPSPEKWTDQQWKKYIRSRRPRASK